jgi:AraC family transcriptional regulator, positive regulator of tynA and feaB
VHLNDDFLSAPELDHDGFRVALREDGGWLSPALEADIIAGKVRTRRVFGFVATDLTCNATRVERTDRIFAVMTRSTITPWFSLWADRKSCRTTE